MEVQTASGQTRRGMDVGRRAKLPTLDRRRAKASLLPSLRAGA